MSGQYSKIFQHTPIKPIKFKFWGPFQKTKNLTYDKMRFELSQHSFDTELELISFRKCACCSVQWGKIFSVGAFFLSLPSALRNRIRRRGGPKYQYLHKVP